MPVDANVLVLGLAFKENCPDIRNTRVIDVVNAFRSYNAHVDVHDPWVDVEEARHEYGLEPITRLEEGRYDAIVVAVAHDQFKAMGAAAIRRLGKAQCVVFDVKHLLPKQCTSGLSEHRATAGGTPRMKVLVTGSAGFIGSAVAERLLARGDEVVGVDNLNGHSGSKLMAVKTWRL